MRRLIPIGALISIGCVAAACGDDDAAPGGSSPDGGSNASSSSSGGASSGDPGSKNDGGIVDPGKLPPPAPTCPAVAPADVGTPDTTLGANGTTCDEAALQAAIDKGGVITFACGGTAAAPFVLALTKELKVEGKDVVIDGGGIVTLSGQKKTRILHIGRDDNFEKLTPKVSVQKLNFVDGHTTDAPATKDTKMGGAAIYRLGGELRVIDSKFVGNIGPTDGQDVAGGAIYSIGGGHTVISGSSFSGNRCSNGGAVGNLGVSGLEIVNSSFADNAATGQNANPGNGGNGGAICFDGPSRKGAAEIAWSMCGTVFSRNSGGNGALGGALFRTVDTTSGPSVQTSPVTIDRSTFDANEAGSAGAMYMHQVDLTITASTFANNFSRKGNAGAIWVEGADNADVMLAFTNVTVANNTAKDGLGGGIVLSSHIKGGEFKHLTVASNAVTTSTGNQYVVFGAGIMGDPKMLKLTNSIVANNQKPALNAGESANCQPGGFIDGGGNVEWLSPEHVEPKRCVAGSTREDPKLAALASGEGPTPTMALGAGSSAIGKGTQGCTDTDQRGHARKTPCAAGAFEP